MLKGSNAPTGCVPVTEIKPRLQSALWWHKEAFSSAILPGSASLRVWGTCWTWLVLARYLCTCKQWQYLKRCQPRPLIVVIPLEDLNFAVVLWAGMQGERLRFQTQCTSLLLCSIRTLQHSTHMQDWTALHPPCEACVGTNMTLSPLKRQLPGFQ